MEQNENITNKIKFISKGLNYVYASEKLNTSVFSSQMSK